MPLTDTYIRSRLVRAARKVSIYKTVIDNLIVQPIAVWSVMSVETLYAKLEEAKAKDASVRGVPNPTRVANQPVYNDEATANYVANDKTQTKERATCYQFLKNGSCKRPNCKFKHCSVSQEPRT